MSSKNIANLKMKRPIPTFKGDYILIFDGNKLFDKYAYNSDTNLITTHIDITGKKIFTIADLDGAYLELHLINGNLNNGKFKDDGSMPIKINVKVHKVHIDTDFIYIDLEEVEQINRIGPDGGSLSRKSRRTRKSRKSHKSSKKSGRKSHRNSRY